MKIIKNTLGPYLSLSRSIHVLFFSTIINQLGNFVGPLLTLLLTYHLRMDLELVGSLVAINALVGLIGSMLGGKLIDTYGRKKVLIIFKGISAFGYISCVILSNTVLLIYMLTLVSFMNGVTTPILSTILTDLTDEKTRKTAFSLNYLAINIGFAVGPLLASFLYEEFIDFLFIGDALTTLLSILLIAVYIPETHKKTKKISKEKNVSLIRILSKRPQLLFFSFAIVLIFISFSQFFFGLPLQITHSFGIENTTYYGVILTLNAITCFIFTIPLTHITRKLTTSTSIILGCFCYALGFGMLFTGSTFAWFIVSTLIWTIGEILVSTNTGVYIAEITPATHRGRFNAIFPIIRKSGAMLGPIIGGLVIANYSLSVLWIVIALVSCASLCIMLTIKKYEIKDIDSYKDVA